MTPTRTRLPNRRLAEHFSFDHEGISYIASYGLFPDGGLAEVFIMSGKAGSAADTAAKDAAVIASIALQYGIPLSTIRKALLRDQRGSPGSPLGVALDFLSSQCTQGGTDANGPQQPNANDEPRG